MQIWKKYSLSVGVKATIAYFMANMINKAIGYLTTPVFTNMMSSEEYGQVSLFLSWLSLFGIVAMFSLQAGVFNNGMMEYKTDRDGFTLSMLVLSNVITAVFAIVLLATYEYTRKFIKLDYNLLFLMISIFFLQPGYNFWITRQRFEYKYKSSTIVMIVMHVLSPIVAILCIVFNVGDGKVYQRIFGAELTLIVFYAFFYIRTIVKGRYKVNTSYWKFAFFFNLPLIPHYLSQYAMNSADRIMISNLIGDSQTAYYSVAYTVAAVVSIVWVSINTSLVPHTYEKCEKKDYKSISNVVTPLWILFASICLLMMIFAPELMLFLAPEEYSVAKYVIPPVIGGVFFQSMYYSFANINYYYKQTKWVMYASLTAAITNIVLNYLLIPKYGFVAAGYTTLVSYIIQAGIDYYAMRRVVKEQIYDLKLIVLLTCIVVAVASLFPLLYKHFMIRYSVLIVLLIIGFCYRKRIAGMMRSVISIRKK